MLEIELKSNELKEFVYLELDKDRNEPIYLEDLEKITELQLDKLDIIGEQTDITLYDLIFFKKLKSCYISNMHISDKELDMLNNVTSLEYLQLDSCSFSNNKKVELNLESLVINECDNVKLSIYEDMSTIKTLHIVNCNNVDISGISKLSNITKLFLQNLELQQIDEVALLKNLEYLNLNGSQIDQLEQITENNKIFIEHEKTKALYDEEF